MDADTAKADEGSDEVYFVSVSYRGVAYEVPVQGDDHLASIFDFVQEALDFPRENCKLICKGKMLRPDNDGLTVSEAGLAPGSKVMLVASSAKDVSFVQSNRSDPLVKGFAEEERDEQSRRKRARAALSAWGTKQDPEFNFGSIKAEFKYSEPPPYEAERLLQRLATDPGIIEIMKTRKFKVGVLTEMSPVEAQDRMAKRGTPNMDLLGYNQNYGGMIVLRLRTDSLKGFRPYHDLINTLIHEMTHNVWGPHDHNFWKLFGELKAQYMRFHRFWSHGGRAADSNAAGQFQGFESEAPESGANFGHVLGGAGAISAEERRVRALEAAQARSEPKEEPASFVPNFLASKGGWMFLCPCGEMHEVSSETKSQLESAFSGNFEGCLMGEAMQDTTPAPEETEPREAEAETEPTNQEVQPETLRAEEQEEAEAEAEMKPVMTEEVQAETGEPEKVSPELSPEHEPAPSASTADPEELPWDLAELEAQGLDGAALWLQRFGAVMQRSQGAAKGPALETLLKLVKNVVSSPGEQKFRRVRAENPAVRARLMSLEGAESMLVLLGFEAATEGGERVFLLSDHGFDLAKLRMGQELLEVELEKMAK